MASAESPITPLKLPKGVRTLIVLGGSFDPPHVGHLVPALSAIEKGRIRDAKVLLVPAARSPHKPAGTAASDRHRIAMLRLLAKRWPGVLIWLDEIRRARIGEPSYTVDTLRRLRRIVPEHVGLRLLIGTDQAAAFHKWREPREIIRLAEPLVLRRKPIASRAELLRAMEHTFWSNSELEAWAGRLTKNALAADNSTAIRAAIPNAPADVRTWPKRPGLRFVDSKIAKYIVTHGLYGFNEKPPAKAGGSGE